MPHEGKTPLETLLEEFVDAQRTQDRTSHTAAALRKLYRLRGYSPEERAQVFATVFDASEEAVTRMLALDRELADYARRLLDWIAAGGHEKRIAHRQIPRYCDPEFFVVDTDAEQLVCSLVERCFAPSVPLLELLAIAADEGVAAAEPDLPVFEDDDTES